MNEELFSISDHEVRESPGAFVDEYLYGVLSPSQSAIIEAWLSTSAENQAALQEAIERKTQIEMIKNEAVPERLIEEVLNRTLSRSAKIHRRWKTFFVVSALATAASVMLIASFHVHFSRLTPTDIDLQVLGQTNVLADSNGALNVAVFRSSTGQSISNVPIEIKLIDDQQQVVTLASFKTGEALPNIRWPDWNSGKYELRVIASVDKDQQEVIFRKIRLQRTFRVMLTTDKPVYQPSQTIHFRSLALRKPDLQPVADAEAMFSVYDSRGNLVFKRKARTSKFGIASADFTLADEINQGDYRIVCQIGDTGSEKTVKVGRYVLPKFKMEIEFDQPYYLPGETVFGKVSAQYFFGKPVAGAKINLSQLTSGPEANLQFPGNLITDKDGLAAFQFELPTVMIGREDLRGKAKLNLLVDAIDSGQQSVSKLESVIVSSNPIQIEIIPESPRLLKDVDNQIYVYTAYADGQPAAAKVSINGEQISLETDSTGLGMFALNPQSDQIGLTVEAVDENELVGRNHVNLSAVELNQAYLLRTDKAVYESGESLEISLIGGGVQPVLIDLLKDGQTVLSKTIEMEQGVGHLTVDLPPELFGTLRLEAYRFDASALPIRAARIIQVQKSNDLNIKIVSDEKTFRPGEKTNVRFQVTGSDGEPTVAALGVAAVDEAIFSVLHQPIGLEKSFFELEQQWLQPVYAIYGQWAADHFNQVPVEQRDRLNQALFARASNFASNRNDPRLANEFFGKDEQDSPDEVVEQPKFSDAHTLRLKTFPAKQRQIRSQRRAGLDAVYASWALLAVILFIVFSTAFAIAWPKAFAIVAAICLPLSCLFCSSFILYSPLLLKEASDSAKSTQGVEQGSSGLKSEELRIRTEFPETLIWQPEIITDETGFAELSIELADSITNWKMAVSAVSANGLLGAQQHDLTVFQPFFVEINSPVELVRGDEIQLPIVVHNYLEKPQTVSLEVSKANWYELLDEDLNAERNADDDSEIIKLAPIELAAGEVKSILLPIRARIVAEGELKIIARSDDASDAIIRNIRVVPDGVVVEKTVSGTLNAPLAMRLEFPENSIPGSRKLLVRVQPSSFNQLVDGLDSIFKMPTGCFEQTSSATYPNVLALKYLRATDKDVPEIEAKARQYISLGYQRLLGFEVRGGGFDWFGKSPASTTLTAYGLMEFEDMAEVHDVDPALIERTRDWLLQRQLADGSWKENSRTFRRAIAQSDEDLNDLMITAYVAWSVYRKDASQSAKTVDYLLSFPASTIDDPYVLAMVANALIATDSSETAVEPYLKRLMELSKRDDKRSSVWWEKPSGEINVHFSRNRSADVETTALVAIALMDSQKHLDQVPRILNWLVQQKDPNGNWHSTQATILALQALLQGMSGINNATSDFELDFLLDEQSIRRLDVDGDQSEVTQQIDLSEHMLDAKQTTLTVQHAGNQAKDVDSAVPALAVQIVSRFNIPGKKSEEVKRPLSISVQYDSTKIEVNETVEASLNLKNSMSRDAPMVLLDIPIPAGFEIVDDDFSQMIQAEEIAKFQISGRKVIVYLRNLEPGQTLNLRYRLRATMPVKVTAQNVRVYEYYDPDSSGTGGETILEATKA